MKAPGFRPPAPLYLANDQNLDPPFLFFHLFPTAAAAPPEWVGQFHSKTSPITTLKMNSKVSRENRRVANHLLIPDPMHWALDSKET
jgi:hypothetical protein